MDIEKTLLEAQNTQRPVRLTINPPNNEPPFTLDVKAVVFNQEVGLVSCHCSGTGPDLWVCTEFVALVEFL